MPLTLIPAMSPVDKLNRFRACTDIPLAFTCVIGGGGGELSDTDGAFKDGDG